MILDAATFRFCRCARYMDLQGIGVMRLEGNALGCALRSGKICSVSGVDEVFCNGSILSYAVLA
jgi:hypothetical protein